MVFFKVRGNKTTLLAKSRLGHVYAVALVTLMLITTSASWAQSESNVLIKDSVEEPEKLLNTCSLNTLLLNDGYKPMNHEAFLDLPDPMTSRSTAALEETYILKLSQGLINAPLIKTFCQIGISRMVVDITYSVEDDSYLQVSLRAIYNWVTNEEVADWQIAELGQKFVCARGRNKSTNLCL